jgi:serine/threonine protein kinase
MEYLQGETLSRMLRAVRQRGELIDPRIVVAVLAQTLHGLHAAHEAKSERGEALNIVHRDISPQNILVGRDGVTKVLDFGVAKAAGRFHTTREGNVKGKLPYMSPEQLRGQPVDRQTDVYAAAVCLWETLTSRKLFKGDNEGSVLEQVLYGAIDPPSRWVSDVPPSLDALVMRGLDRDKTKRFATAREFAIALERAVHPALASDIGDWVEVVAGQVLTERAERIAEIESVTDSVPAMGLTEVMSGLGEPSQAVPAAPSSGMIGGSSSQVSSISVAASDRDPMERPRRGRALIALVAVASVIIVGVVGIAFMAGRGTGASAASSNSVVSTATAQPTDLKPAASATPPPTSLETASAAPSTTAAATTTTKATRWTAQPRNNDDCKIPYTLGPNGEKIYKRHCY